MKEYIHIDRDTIFMLRPLGQIQQAITYLRPHAVNFNRLSVVGATQEHETEVILETLKTIAVGLSGYGAWKANALASLDDISKAQSQFQNVVKLAAAMEETPIPRPNIDPRKLLRLDMMTKEVIPYINSIWYSIYSSGGADDFSVKTYTRLLARVTYNLKTVLTQALKAFNIQFVIEKFDMPGTPILFDETVVFELHDDVVAFSEEELAEQRRLEEIQAENERRAQELKEAKASMASNIKSVLDAYDRHIKIGNLKKFSYTDEALALMHNPSSLEDLEKCNSVWRLLMAMSNSVRYMPGETASTEDRIMGSYMELENDIVSYGQQFTVYMHEYDLSHNDVVNALSMFSDENGKIVAQYVDSKEYLEDFMEDSKSPKMIHIFVMK